VQQAFVEDGLSARESHGHRVFVQRCATCHGAAGRGDGLSALSPKDRRRVIEGGTAALGRSALCPPWGRSLDEPEVEALLAYLVVAARPTADEGPPEWGRRRWRRPR
jgi:mono/diheme cytochrome c family protein